MNTKEANAIWDELIASLDIPDSTFEKVEARYKNLKEWFLRPDSNCFRFDPQLYVQGSFRLGTVNRPLTPEEEYDLDMGCRLLRGILKSTHTQADLKELVRVDMEAYRRAHQFLKKLEEKNRCWRLPYADEMNFHLDAVPSIPETEATRLRLLRESMVRAGSTAELAESVVKHAGSITDKTRDNYNVINLDWPISNSEGYAIWFEFRIRTAISFLQRRIVEARVNRIEDLPTWRWKSPLQQAVQALKRHRDVMFADNHEGQPISIIITTLAAQAYQGESDIVTALRRILGNMGQYVSRQEPRVPNPVNPSEDFADKWSKAEYRHLNLEANFWGWLEQAQNDFRAINNSTDADFIRRQIKVKFGIDLSTEKLQRMLGQSPRVVTTPKVHVITEAAKPWRLP